MRLEDTLKDMSPRPSLLEGSMNTCHLSQDTTILDGSLLGACLLVPLAVPAVSEATGDFLHRMREGTSTTSRLTKSIGSWCLWFSGGIGEGLSVTHWDA